MDAKASNAPVHAASLPQPATPKGRPAAWWAPESSLEMPDVRQPRSSSLPRRHPAAGTPSHRWSTRSVRNRRGREAGSHPPPHRHRFGHGSPDTPPLGRSASRAARNAGERTRVRSWCASRQ
jgi:hypothetical protein